MLKSGENVIMMDEIRNPDDVYGRLTDVVRTLTIHAWTRPMPNVSHMARARSYCTVDAGHRSGALHGTMCASFVLPRQLAQRCFLEHVELNACIILGLAKQLGLLLLVLMRQHLCQLS